MSEFKVGDKVRVISDTPDFKRYLNLVGTITEVDVTAMHYYRLFLDLSPALGDGTEGRTILVRGDEIELLEPESKSTPDDDPVFLTSRELTALARLLESLDNLQSETAGEIGLETIYVSDSNGDPIGYVQYNENGYCYYPDGGSDE